MKLKLLLPLILLLGISQISFSQEEQDHSVSTFLNFSGLLHPKLSGLVVGGEYRWNPHFGIHQQLGYIYADYEATYSNFINKREKRGFRTSTELRWYRHSFDYSMKTRYVGLHVRYWNYDETGEYEFCRENCLYQQFLEYELRQYGVGMGLSRGAIKHWGKHIYMDYGVSFGFIYRNNQTNIPQDARTVNNRFDFNKPNPKNFDTFNATFLFYLKFGYSF